jgi:hypothetical protein
VIARIGLFLSLALSEAALSQVQPLDPSQADAWSITPASPTTRSFVEVRLDVSGCVALTDLRIAYVDPATREIRLDYLGSDICTIEESSYFVPVGYLAAGNWRVVLYGCDGAQPTHCSPLQRPNLLFGVAEAGRPRRTIPAWSFAGAFATVFLLAGIALLRLKAR